MLKMITVTGAALFVAAPVQADALTLEDMLDTYAEQGIHVASKAEVVEMEREAATQYPLGDFNYPVRANMPKGQRAYLSRLRCADGKAPSFTRTGNLGFGVYGFIVDRFSVDCENAAPGNVDIVMDMYHDHVETKAVPGFTIVAP